MPEIGSTWLTVAPSAKDFGKKLSAQIGNSGVGSLLGKTMGAAFKIAAPAAILAGVGKIKSEGVKFGKAMEQYAVGFRRITNSAEELNYVLNAVEMLKLTSPFNKSDISTWNTQLLNAGVPVSDLQRQFRNLGDAVGGNREGMEYAVRMFGQVAAGGGIANQQMIALAQRGFDPMRVIANATGQTLEEVNRQFQGAEGNARAFTKALELVADENHNFYGSMADMGNTLAGAISNAKDAYQVFSLAFIGGLNGPILTGMTRVNQEVQRMWTGLYDLAKASPGLQRLNELIGVKMEAKARLTADAVIWLGERLFGVLDTISVFIYRIKGPFAAGFTVIKDNIGGLGAVFRVAGGGFDGLSRAATVAMGLVRTSVLTTLDELTQGQTGYARGLYLIFRDNGFVAAAKTGLALLRNIIANSDFMAGIQETVGRAVEWLTSDGINQIVAFFMGKKVRMAETALVFFMPIVDSVVEILPQVIEAASNLIPKIAQAIVAQAPVLLDRAITVFKTLVDAVAHILPLLVGAILGLVVPLVGAILDMLPALLQAGIELFIALVDAVFEVLPDLLDSIIETVFKVIDALLDMLPNLLDSGIKLFMQLVDAVIRILPRLLNMLTNTLLPRVLDTVIGMIPRLLEAAVTLFLALVTAVIEITPRLMVMVLGLIPQLVVSIVSGVAALHGAGLELMGGMFTGVQRIGSNLLDWMRRLPGTILGSLGDAGGLLVDWGRSLINGLLDGINSMLDRVRGIGSTVRNLLPFSQPINIGGGEQHVTEPVTVAATPRGRVAPVESQAAYGSLNQTMRGLSGAVRSAFTVPSFDTGSGYQLDGNNYGGLVTFQQMLEALDRLADKFHRDTELTTAGLIDMRARDLATKRGPVWAGQYGGW